ncbi:MAG: 30S ribosomal protein S13 [Candidatus Moranbacteria bacterium CG_4_10_14_3_um_filter_45_9]|nr:MAG: 30S ribosomal protein S13 [Candidatus Moranbacteria bacterium CG2_30_45_14]PIX90216.1 MAG: 30S ribosomal protein S13 [Candidatus Moranbacteria bacterium CG_4_10_14_3_um_filter_45_9]PJA84989.1 MAG: 30S ribosomal protein S13 [Candidatus Moranbacteria bacterium CG_4_9_14_3_um_filter_45_14]
MVRIAGINIPDNKRIEIALTYIYGIGLSASQKTLKELTIDVNTRTKDLTAEDANRLRDLIEKKLRVEGELRHIVKNDIKRLKEIGCYRGIRHQKGLPSRGQRTKTNTRTVRGNTRKTMGSGRKKSSDKT